MICSTRVRRAALLITSIAAFAGLTASANAATVVNGDFETGSVSGWQVYNQVDSGGDWITYTADDFEPAAKGSFSAVAVQGDPSTSILYQDVALEAGYSHELSLDYFINNLASVWFTPNNYSYDTPQNQQYAIDVIKATADPFSHNPADVLATIRRTDVSDPFTIPWTHATANLSAFAGQTVRLRYVNVNNQMIMNTGLDNVAITSVNTPPVVTPPTLTTAKFPSSGKGAGTTISLTSDQAGTATLTFYRSDKGKKSGKKCVKPSKKLAKKKNCKRWVKLSGKVTATLVAGVNNIAFNGKLKNKALKPGNYKFELVVTDSAGLASPAQTKTFKVVAPKKKK